MQFGKIMCTKKSRFSQSLLKKITPVNFRGQQNRKNNLKKKIAKKVNQVKSSSARPKKFKILKSKT